MSAKRNQRLAVGLLAIVLIVIAGFLLAHPLRTAAQDLQPVQENHIYLPIIAGSPPLTGEYVLLGWNDLGMHCYNRDFSNLAVLPPYNNLWAQVILRGDPPQIVTTGISVNYYFPENTYSVGKSNFWDYAQALFGVQLAPNIGLTGKGLAGMMDVQADHFVAEGIPLTEYTDSAPTTRQPYQLATVEARDLMTGKIIASNQVVAPVSTEMHCDYCHSDNGEGNEGIHTGTVETNILTKHDQENMEEYPSGHTGALMDRRPILCAECHASNALGAPGVAGLPSLSHAIHNKHAEEGVSSSLDGCYSCHPGPNTRCLRDVMSQRGMECRDCHGDLHKVSLNPDPWLQEPRCDAVGCHSNSVYALDQPLYRQSKGHGGVYCEGCHDSTHAIALSREPRDAIKFVNLQGHAGTLQECTVCHLTQPTTGGPHTLATP